MLKRIYARVINAAIAGKNNLMLKTSYSGDSAEVIHC